MKILLLLPALLMGYSTAHPPAISMKGYFACEASLLEETGDALACYAATQSGCQNGTVVLAFKKRRSKRDEKAVFEIVDTVHVKTANPSRWLSIARCTAATGKTRQYFVLFKDDGSSTRYLRNIKRVWGVSAQNKLVEVPPQTVKCLNDDYGAN